MLFSNENSCVALIKRQVHVNIDRDTCENLLVFSTGLTVVVQHKDGDSDAWNSGGIQI